MSELYTKAAQTILAATVALLAAASPGCRAPGGQTEPAEGSAGLPPAVPVEYVRVVRATMVDTVVATTTMRSTRTATIQARAAGRLRGFGLRSGSTVQPGAIGASVDSPAHHTALDEARDTLRRAEAAATDLEPLLAQGYVARRVHDDAVALVEQANTQLERAELALDDLPITSPMEGVVSEVLVADGELVVPNQVLARVVSLDELDAVAAIPEREASRLRVGMPALLSQAGSDTQPLEAEVAEIAPIVSARVGTIDVTVRTAGAASWLRPGTLVSVGIVVDTHNDALVIPKRALLWEADEAWVFAVATGEGSGEAAAVAERRRVVLGYEDARRVEVLEGLRFDDAVIVTGQTGLEPGDAISLVTERTDLLGPTDPP